MNITDRVKSFEDATRILGIENDLPDVSMLGEQSGKKVIAFYKLTIITKALNEDWSANWENWDEDKYFPIFKMGIIEEGFVLDGYNSGYSSSSVVSDLCFKSPELLSYAAGAFRDLYKDYFL